MTVKLPSNPWTISDSRLQANKWSPETVAAKYAGRHLTSELIAEIDRDLAELNSWDNYERKTSEMREATKAALLQYRDGLVDKNHCGIGVVVEPIGLVLKQQPM